MPIICTAGRWNHSDVVMKKWNAEKVSVSDLGEFCQLLQKIQHLSIIKLHGLCESPTSKHIGKFKKLYLTFYNAVDF